VYCQGGMEESLVGSSSGSGNGACGHSTGLKPAFGFWWASRNTGKRLPGVVQLGYEAESQRLEGNARSQSASSLCLHMSGTFGSTQVMHACDCPRSCRRYSDKKELQEHRPSERGSVS
jgi:hypothetical protein